MLFMKVEYAPSCMYCERRPACEIAEIVGEQLEKAAKDLGYTVTEGSVICLGKESQPRPLHQGCGVRINPPNLASEEERQKIATLAELDSRANALYKFRLLRYVGEVY
ncbi:MAG: hypothetical protein ACYCPS_00675 [Candidatus Saccharimonadales bacterium]